MDQDELVLSVEASPVTEDNSIAATATVGVAYSEASQPPEIGPGSTIRGGTTIYDDVVTGSGFQTGHNALVREQTVVGDDVLVGTNAVIDGKIEIGDSVSLQTGVYIPQQTAIGSNVFCGPSATLLNDPYPVQTDSELDGPTVSSGVSIGANATILPGVTLGKNAFVAAGAVVTRDVPPETLAVGHPAECEPLPEQLQAPNDL